MKDWIMELCPEIAAWQAELIAEEAQKQVLAEREACAKVCEGAMSGAVALMDMTREMDARAIRARSKT